MTMSYPTLLAFLICFLVNFELLQSYGFRIKLIPIDRFDTTFFPKNLTLQERYQRIFEISRARVYQLESMVSTMNQKESIQHNPNALQPPVVIGNRNYFLTTLSVGTRRYSPHLVVDTGSVDTWMQCEGCRHCFFNREGNFNRSQSHSYQPLPCDDPLCEPRLCQNNFCMYDHRCFGSGDGGCHTSGQVGSDTFTFGYEGSFKRYPHTAFGCGLYNTNLDWEKSGQNNSIAGVLGLGRGRRSIIMQYVYETQNRISYCLQPLGHPHAFTYLLFGIDTHFSHTFHYAKLIPNVTQYAVEVSDISINRKRLGIDPSVFLMRPNKTGGFILDTGIPHTALVRPAYIKVKREIVEYFRREHNWHPLPPQPDQLDLCYRMPHKNFTAPNMTYHFRGERTTLDLGPRNVFQFFDASFCLMVMPINEPGPSRLGALQQSDIRFVFDFTESKVYFLPEICGPI